MCMMFTGPVHLVLRSTHVRVDLGSWGLTRSRGAESSSFPRSWACQQAPSQAGHLRTRTGILSKPGAASIFCILPLCTDLPQCRLTLSHPSQLSMSGRYLGVQCPGPQGAYPPTRGRLSCPAFSAPICPGSRAQASKGRTTSPHPCLRAKTAQREGALCPMRILQLAQS